MKEKIGALGLPQKEAAQLYKFGATLNLLNIEQIEKTVQILAEFDMALKKGSHMKIAFLEEMKLNERLNYAKDLGFIEEINKDPLKLLESRIFVLQKDQINEEPVINEISQEPIDKQERINNLDDNLIISILSKPQTIGLTDETYQRYEVLSNSINQILATLNGMINNEIDIIYDNLIKLVTSNIPNDELVVYSSIIFGRNLSVDEKEIIKDVIKKEFAIINRMNEGEERKIA